MNVTRDLLLFKRVSKSKVHDSIVHRTPNHRCIEVSRITIVRREDRILLHEVRDVLETDVKLDVAELLLHLCIRSEKRRKRCIVLRQCRTVRDFE